MYDEGRPCVHVRSVERPPDSPRAVFGEWKPARVLLWQDEQAAPHVTVVTLVSRPTFGAPPHPLAPALAWQDDPVRVLLVEEYDFLTVGESGVVVIEKALGSGATQATRLGFAGCAALRDLFVARLRANSAAAGDDTGLRLLLCPCAEDVWRMLSTLDLSHFRLDVLQAMWRGMKEAGVAKGAGGSSKASLHRALTEELHVPKAAASAEEPRTMRARKVRSGSRAPLEPGRLRDRPQRSHPESPPLPRGRRHRARLRGRRARRRQATTTRRRRATRARAAPASRRMSEDAARRLRARAARHHYSRFWSEARGLCA